MKMQRRHFLLGAAASASAAGCSSIAPVKPLFVDDKVTQWICPAEPDWGYNFPYILQVPSQAGRPSVPYLLVETNNSGPISTEIGPHLQPTSELARQGLGGRVGLALNTPLLMPVFPRDEMLYTHSLGRSTLLTEVQSLRRLDLQLLAMSRDARRRLSQQGRLVSPKLVLTGFSASAMFATRLAALHPKEVAAVVAGGLNGFVILPVDRLSGTRLTYPLGVSDLREVAGRAFDEKAWRKIPQFLFMGATDENDAVDFDDSYSSADRQTIHSLLGKRMVPDRWQACEAVYRSIKAPARFKTYAGLGHGTSRLVHQECASFVREVPASEGSR
jgi:pimeloyl-ACP methyl ester carboxylesterase